MSYVNTDSKKCFIRYGQEMDVRKFCFKGGSLVEVCVNLYICSLIKKYQLALNC